jgi:LacI family transcriptional regulator
MPTRSLRSRPNVLLAMGYFVHEFNVGVARYAHDAGWILEDLASHTGVVKPEWDGDGIITVVDNPSSPLIGFLEKARAPIVNLSGQLPHLPYPRVLHDNHAIGRLAAEELLGRGFRHAAFFTLARGIPVIDERMGGFREMMLEAGCSFQVLDYTDRLANDTSPKAMIRWLAGELTKLPKPIGTMAQFDADANIIVQACIHAGLNVPEQVAVVGVDNDPIYSELGPVPLTSVMSNRELLGYRGAELLDRLMRGEKPPAVTERVPPGGIVVRRSTDIFAINDEGVAKALRYIKDHGTGPITVEAVVRASGVSRRTLYAKFERSVGRTIQVEIVRQRLNVAKYLLSTTNSKLGAIAYDSGFESAVALCKVFRAYENLTPSAYREKHRRHP